MRGRLIFPFWVELAKLDTQASTYDPVFKEPTLSPAGRVEHEPVFFQAQVEPASFEALAQQAAGDMPDSDIVLVAHFEFLERNGLVDPATGLARINKNDRLVAIREGGCSAPGEARVVLTVRDPPGLYVVRCTPRGFGIGHSRNLLEVAFNDRERAARTG